jgi:hypothetical protein
LDDLPAEIETLGLVAAGGVWAPGDTAYQGPAGDTGQNAVVGSLR